MLVTFFIKSIVLRWVHLPSFCKHCGRTIHDFSVSNEIWAAVDPHIRGNGHTLCYDCFCEVCKQLGLPCVWRLELLTKEHIDVNYFHNKG